MINVGKVLSIHISSQGIAMPVKKEIIEVDQKGIRKDKHYDSNIKRSVLITSLESYQLAKENDIFMPSCSLGENLLIDYNPYNLPIGSQFQIGEALFQITQRCTLCDHLSKIDKKLPDLLRNDRGIFAQVIKRGTVKAGDTIYLLDQET